jgi:hypothetical protein
VGVPEGLKAIKYPYSRKRHIPIDNEYYVGFVSEAKEKFISEIIGLIVCSLFSSVVTEASGRRLLEPSMIGVFETKLEFLTGNLNNKS